MNFSPYSRRPFDIEATEITEENFDEIAELIGREVSEDENGRCIIIDRRVVPSSSGRVYLGWWLTKVGDNFRCYNPDTFRQQFQPGDPDDDVPYSVFDEQHRTYRGLSVHDQFDTTP